MYFILLRSKFTTFFPFSANKQISFYRLKVELRDVTSDNIKELKHLNTIIFPVSYNLKFYKNLLESKGPAKLGNFFDNTYTISGVLGLIYHYFSAYYGNTVAGAVCCRIDTTQIGRKLYIVTLGCPYQYRRLGIGTQLLECVLDYAREDGNFDSIYLLV